MEIIKNLAQLVSPPSQSMESILKNKIEFKHVDHIKEVNEVNVMIKLEKFDDFLNYTDFHLEHLDEIHDLFLANETTEYYDSIIKESIKHCVNGTLNQYRLDPKVMTAVQNYAEQNPDHIRDVLLKLDYSTPELYDCAIKDFATQHLRLRMDNFLIHDRSKNARIKLTNYIELYYDHVKALMLELGYEYPIDERIDELVHIINLKPYFQVTDTGHKLIITVTYYDNLLRYRAYRKPLMIRKINYNLELNIDVHKIKIKGKFFPMTFIKNGEYIKMVATIGINELNK